MTTSETAMRPIVHSGSLVAHLDRVGDRPCLGDDGQADTWLTARQVAAELRDRAHRFGPGRRLVCLAARPSLDRVLDQLAAVDAGHAVLVAADEQIAGLVSRWRPDTIVDDAGIHLKHAAPDHDLHPDLAMLLSTSGSTGSPKLVRLSRQNLVANARSIAEYLRLGPDDRGITSLPLHYCYGLSVLHAHLAAGAAIRLTDASVVDPCFWQAVDEGGVTNLAGVPHTFELLDRLESGWPAPSIRLVTQAGGRMAPERVQQIAALGRANGFELVVMYGQTEATARMGYLPPELAIEHPDAVGVPIPGGSFEIRSTVDDQPLPHGETGRVVYRGPNVMMGYATAHEDLARPHELDELVTGDLGTIGDDGLLRIVGREARFAKLFGLRVDLARVETRLSSVGVTAIAVSDDDRLGIVAAGSLDVGSVDAETVRDEVSATTGLPRRCIDVVGVDELPRTTTGKPDTAAAAALLSASSEATGTRTRSVADEYRVVLGVRPRPHDTFVGLGGDSFSYVELSVRLETRLGSLPSDWHLRTLEQLERHAAEHRGHTGVGRWVARADTTIVLRAAAILLIVASHMRLVYLPVGAHVLLAVGGYNFARFQLAATDRSGWWRSVASTFGKIAAISSAWIASQMLLFGDHSLGTVFLVNSYLGDPDFTGSRWRYWYIEAIVHIGIVLLGLFAWSRVRALERRHPFWFPIGLLVPALALRFGWIAVHGDTRNDIFQADTLIWLFLIGWALQRSDRLWQRLLVTAIAMGSVAGFFFHDDRSLRLAVGLLVLAWVPWIPVPRLLHRTIAAIASASLAIYLTHYATFPELDDHLADRWVFPLTIAIGVAVWWLGRSVSVVARRRWSALIGVRSIERADGQVSPADADGRGRTQPAGQALVGAP